MDAAARFAKTDQGVDEIRERRNNVRGKLRMLLILVDPNKPAAVLQDAARQLGVTPDFLDALQRDGYIARVGAPQDETAGIAAGTDVPAARRFMTETLRAALGGRSAELVTRVERCASREALAQLVRDYERAISDVSGVMEAEALASRLRKLLA